MNWDLGVYGIGTLLVLSLAFGAIAQAIVWRSSTHWMWLIGAVAFFISGLLISEWLFGTATATELQPNIDGLSFDETLLAIIPASIVVGLTWYVTRAGDTADAV